MNFMPGGGSGGTRTFYFNSGPGGAAEGGNIDPNDIFKMFFSSKGGGMGGSGSSDEDSDIFSHLIGGRG